MNQVLERKAPASRPWAVPLAGLLTPTAFFAAALLWQELWVKLFCVHALTVEGMAVTALFVLPATFLLGLLCGSVPRRAGVVLLPVMMGIITVWVGAQVAYYSLFRTYLSLYSVTQAGMVLKNFGMDAVYAVLNNWLPLLLVLVPFLLSLLLRRRLVPERREGLPWRCCWGAAAVLGAALAMTVTASSVEGTLSLSELVDASSARNLQVANFGVLATTALEVRDILGLGQGEALPEVPEEMELPEEEPPEGAVEEMLPLPPEEPPEEEPVYGDNVLTIDFDALMAEESDETLLRMHEYFSQAEPTAKNPWTGYFAGKNLIWIVAEGYSGQVAIDPEVTPTLYRLSQEGFRFNNFYTPLWGVSTSDGEYVTTTGLIPKSGAWSYRESADNYMPFGFGNLFSHLGYQTMAFHDHDYTYYDRDKSHPNMGYDYYAVGHGLEISDTWPESDLEMMEASIPRYIDEEQFLTYYMTVSGHLDYGFSTNDMAAKNKEVVEDLPYSSEAQAYLATQVELDRALAYLIEELEKAGKLEDTVIALSGDHYPYGLSQDAFDELAGHEVDQTFELYKSQLILWCDDMEEPVEVDKFCSSLDIMPTLANLFGLPYDSRLVMGRDILSDSPGLVMFSNYSFLTDLGAYDAVTDTFTPWEGVEAPEDYAAQVLEQVQGKFDFSRLILEEDYYRVIFGEKTPWDFLPEEDLPEKNASYGPTAAIR